MPEIVTNPSSGENAAQFLSDVLIDVREEDTKPATVSESFRKKAAERYGRKSSHPPTNGPAERPKES